MIVSSIERNSRIIIRMVAIMEFDPFCLCKENSGISGKEAEKP
jgi:hypothetical protein